MLAAPLAAQAQPVTGFYVGAGAGVNWLMESDVELSGQFRGAFPNRTGNVEFSTGYVGVISVGYGYGNGFRAEIEGSYRANEVDSASGFTGTLTTPVRSSGDAYSYGIMVNALYDFDMGASSFFHPYLGIGIGAQVHHYDSVTTRGANGAGVFLNDGEWLFAYQAIAGASFPIASVPGLSITAEYRFMGTQEASIEARTATSPNVVTRGSANVDNFNHSLLIGLRYAFGVTPPPPAPAPAAAPAPARTFLVFFDFDRADLTDRARQIIAEAATNSQRAGTTRIEVSGHADTVGTPQYNQALSVRRANAVAAELERRGVARSAMTIQGFGFTRPLVPTGPQVREPQNRRVEIVLR
jgi:OOP family OmpA-OmpF porin